ncbi:MAG: AP2 domain-containing protein [Pseudomonadota bacterium]
MNSAVKGIAFDTQKQYGITRIDDSVYRTHAWRVSLRRRGKMFVKNFADKKFGGKKSALLEAIKYRNCIVSKYPPITRKECAAIKRRNNRSGVPGVYTYSKTSVRKDGSINEHWYWEASWPTELGESGRIAFSTRTYGEERARLLAMSARRQGLAKVQGFFWKCQLTPKSKKLFRQLIAAEYDATLKESSV